MCSAVVPTRRGAFTWRLSTRGPQRGKMRPGQLLVPAGLLNVPPGTRPGPALHSNLVLGLVYMCRVAALTSRRAR